MHPVKENLENSVQTKKDLHSGPSVPQNLERKQSVPRAQKV